ncbi:MAG TPA: hypothetical protein VGE13_01960 [Candidatus Saccharimonadales bacterium]
MIEINLVPDVKLELIKARRMRSMVVSGAILLSMIAGGIVVALSAYTFGVQGIANWSLDREIDDGSKKLQSVEGLSEMLTIQSQLDQLQTTHEDKLLTSKLFALLSKIAPNGVNTVQFSKTSLNVEEDTITLEASAKNDFEALEVFKKTLAATQYVYTQDGQKKTVNVASDIQDSDRSFGENSEGQSVLRFTLSFVYAPEIFQPDFASGEIVTPKKQNATDSKKGVPNTLFTDGATPKENQ